MKKKSVLFLFFMLLIVWAANAQTPNLRWVNKVQGAPLYQTMGRVQLDNMGNSYLLQGIRGPLNDTIRLFISKIDPLGNLLWRKKVAMTPNLLGIQDINGYRQYGFRMTANGQFYIALISAGEVWNFYSNTSTTQTINSQNLNMNYFIVAKLDQDGNLLWLKQTMPISSSSNAGYNPQYLDDIFTDDEGAVYLYGLFCGIQDFDPGPNVHTDTAAGSNQLLNPFLWKLNAAGSFEWLNNFGGNRGVVNSINFNNIYANNVAISQNKEIGNQRIILIGAVQDTSDFNPGSAVTMINPGNFMAEYKTNGDLIWAGNTNQFNSANNGISIVGVASDDANNLYLSAYYQGSPNIAGPFASPHYLPYSNPGDYKNACIAKLDTSGNVLWIKIIKADSGKGRVFLGIPVVDTENQLYLPGFINCDSICSINFNTIANPVLITTSSPNEGIVLKLTANAGSFGWLYHIKGTSTTSTNLGSWVSSLAKDQYNNVYASGSAFGGVDFTTNGPSNIWYPMGGYGYFLLKLGECPPNVDSATAYACHSYVLGGQSFDSSGFYAVQLPASNSSCDSIVALTLHLQPVDPSISTDGDTLIANAPGATYQWLHCDGNGGYQLVPGATDRHFIPPTPGNYAVAVSYQDCKDTSGCVLGIENVPIGANVQIAPNPATNQFHVLFSQTVRHMHLKLVNAVGQTLWQEADFSGQTLTVNMQQYSAGLYYLSIQNEKGVVVKKVVKW